jgi:hypothetical protein
MEQLSIKMENAETLLNSQGIKNEKPKKERKIKRDKEETKKERKNAKKLKKEQPVDPSGFECTICNRKYKYKYSLVSMA